jgi:VHL beta domain
LARQVATLPLSVPPAGRFAAQSPFLMERTMRRFPLTAVLMLASVAGIACSDDAATTPLEPSSEASLALSTACATPPGRSLPYQLPKFTPRSMIGRTSLNSNEYTDLRFTNATCLTVSVYWLDYQGNRTLYAILAPGQSYVQGTFVTHPWIITGHGEDLVGFMPESGVSGRQEAYIAK